MALAAMHNHAPDEMKVSVLGHPVQNNVYALTSPAVPMNYYVCFQCVRRL